MTIHSRVHPGFSRSGFYAILDPEHVNGRDTLRVAERLLLGGCVVLQLRAKKLGDRELVALAHAIHQRCVAVDVAFVVNDRPDIAWLVGAEGVHLGQTDMRVSEARAFFGSAHSAGSVDSMRSAYPVAIGVSTHTLEQARSAVAEGADLIGVGPVFPTGSKQNAEPVVGLQRLQEIVRAVSVLSVSAPVPVVAIGGIDVRRVRAVMTTGARFVAAIGAVLHAGGAGDADAVEAAARAMHQECLGDLGDGDGDGDVVA